MSKALPLLINVVAVSACASLLCACSNQKQVSYTSGDVTQTFTEGKASVPDDFPLPVYPKAQATGGVSAAGQKDSDITNFLMLSTNDSVDAVSTYYRQQLKILGWKVDQIDSLGTEDVNISASKKGQEAGISISSEGKQTVINLQISKTAAPGFKPNYAGPKGLNQDSTNLTPTD